MFSCERLRKVANGSGDRCFTGKSTERFFGEREMFAVPALHCVACSWKLGFKYVVCVFGLNQN